MQRASNSLTRRERKGSMSVATRKKPGLGRGVIADCSIVVLRGWDIGWGGRGGRCFRGCWYRIQDRRLAFSTSARSRAAARTSWSTVRPQTVSWGFCVTCRWERLAWLRRHPLASSRRTMVRRGSEEVRRRRSDEGRRRF
jgi:hypothetical protein